MPLTAGTLFERLRSWVAQDQLTCPSTDEAAHSEVQAYLTERCGEMSHWLFLVRTGLALGVAGYFAISALATATAWPTGTVLLALGYAAANTTVRLVGRRRPCATPWAYAFLDLSLILLLYGFFEGVLWTTLGPGVGLVASLVLVLLIYTLLGNPTLNAVLSLAALGITGSAFYLFPGLAAEATAAGIPETPLHAFLLVEYLSIACLVTCLLALRLHRRLVAYSRELHRRLEANLKADLEEERRRHLEAVGQLKRDFILVLSHELRNPVAPLLSSLEAVQEDAEQGRGDPALVGVAVDAARELQQLVGDYTHLAELLTRPLEEATRWNIPLGPVAEATAARLRKRADENGDAGTLPHFIFEGLDDRAVASDPPLLQDTMHALLRRAACRTAAGGVVTVRGFDENGDVGFAVHDPDSHLDADTLASIDDLFAPSDERLYSGSGTGLELLLARHALRRVGGRMRAESALEAGTTIYCVLPAASPEHAWAEEKHLPSFFAGRPSTSAVPAGA